MPDEPSLATRRLDTHVPDDFRDYIFTRLGGAGMATPLWECVICGSAVSDRPRHDGWHKDRNRRLFGGQ